VCFFLNQKIHTVTRKTIVRKKSNRGKKTFRLLYFLTCFLPRQHNNSVSPPTKKRRPNFGRSSAATTAPFRPSPATKASTGSTCRAARGTTDHYHRVAPRTAAQLRHTEHPRSLRHGAPARSIGSNARRSSATTSTTEYYIHRTRRTRTYDWAARSRTNIAQKNNYQLGKQTIYLVFFYVRTETEKPRGGGSTCSPSHYKTKRKCRGVCSSQPTNQLSRTTGEACLPSSCQQEGQKALLQPECCMVNTKS